MPLRRISLGLGVGALLTIGVVVATSDGAPEGNGHAAKHRLSPRSPTAKARSVLLGTGEIRGQRYRVVAKSYHAARSTANADEATPCVWLMLGKHSGPARGHTPIGECLTGHYRRRIRRALVPATYGAERRLLPEAQVVMQGLAGNDVNRVRLRYTDTRGRAHGISMAIFYLSRKRSRQLGSKRITRFFVGFIPQGIFSGVGEGQHRHPITARRLRQVFSRVRLTTFRADGSVIRRQTLKAERYWQQLLLTPPVGYPLPKH